MRDVTINRDRLTTVMEKMCDDYCFYATVSRDEEILHQHCDECPLNNIECDDYWEGRDDE